MLKQITKDGVRYEVSRQGDDILLINLTPGLDEERLIEFGFFNFLSECTYVRGSYVPYPYRVEYAEDNLADYALAHFNEAKIFTY